MKNGGKTARTLVALLLFTAVAVLCGCGNAGKSLHAEGAERAELLYASVEVLPNRETSSLLSRPADCPQEIGPALGTMLSLYEADPDRLYHVAFCLHTADGRGDRDAVAGKLQDPDVLFADAWVALSEIASPESGGDADGWFYFLFKADEVRTLASAGLQCCLVGSGKALSADKLTQEQAIEHICQFNGDAFRASQAKTSE